jgi:HAD superfamily hydrolase (TIGR01509 family)
MSHDSPVVNRDDDVGRRRIETGGELRLVDVAINERVSGRHGNLVRRDPINERSDRLSLQWFHAKHEVSVTTKFEITLCQSDAVTLTTTLFDMDGLLLDSEILWHQAELEILGRLGVPLIEHGTRSTKGMFVAEVVDFWYAQFPWTQPERSVVVTQVLKRVGDLVESQGQLMPGAIRALDLTQARGPLGLASSTPVALIERCLAHFGLRDRFVVVTSAADELYGKPHPAVFLTAAQRLGVLPDQCVVFEDSSAGVLAAKAARMTCVAVPVEDERSLPAFALADLVLHSLDDLEPTWLDERF